jgi:hypothetical protein
MASEVHHAKAQQLLLQIDLAKHQRAANEELRNEMLDSEDRLLHLHEQLYVHRMHNDANEALEEAQAKLLAFETSLSYSQSTKRLEAARFVEDCGLLATAEMLTTEDSVCSLRAIDAASIHMRKILSEYPDGDMHLRRYIQGALDVLHRAGRLVQTMGIESDGWLPVVGPVLQALETLVQCRPIEEPLGRLVDEIEELAVEDHRLQDKIRESAEAGETGNGEEFTRDRIMVLEGIADLVTHKFRVIENIDEGTLSVLQKETGRIRNVTIENAKLLLDETQGKRTVLTQDLSRMQEQQHKAKRDQDLARTAFLDAKAQSDASLKRIATHQHDCWVKMIALEKQLRELAVERRDEVDRRTRMVEREERRRCDMQHFESFAAEHEQILKHSLSSCEAEEELGQMMQEVVLQACQAVDAKVQSMHKKLDQTRVAAYTEHSERFREQYLHLGDVLYRKERLVDELDRRIDMLNLQQDMAMQTFNPKAKFLSEQRAELEVERANVHGFIEALQEKAAAYVEAFKPTEKALRSISNTYVHPIVELQKNNKARSRKLDLYYASTVQDAELADAAQASGVHPQLVRSAAEIEAERALLQVLKQAPMHRPYANRDGTLPTVDPMKRSDFNPLGLEGKDGERRRAPRTIKSKLHQALNDADAMDGSFEAASNGSPTGGIKQPTALADLVTKLRSGAFGLAEALEPAGGRALTDLKRSVDDLD